MSAAAQDRPPSPTPSQLPPVPSSPTYSVASTANPLSGYNLPAPPPPRPLHAVLTKADLEASHTSYTDLLASAKAYRLALAQLSTAASAFGSALESCARLKEARAPVMAPSRGGGPAALHTSFTAGSAGACTADMLLSASGVHHLVANHQQILSETVYRSFEVPLLDELDKWRRDVEDEDETYQRNAKTQSREIRRLEKEGLKLHKQRRRDVGRFRAHLVELTTKLDGLTTLHADHARTLLRESQETSSKIMDASCSLVRAEVDIFESLARKGWSGGGLEDLLEKGQDLFAADDAANGGTAAETAKLFSILPPKSILADTASDSGRPEANRVDSLLADPDRYQSLAGLASDPGRGRTDTDSMFNQPRGARPFSPQPIRRNPTDVTFDSLGGVAGPSTTKDDEEEEDMTRSRIDLRMPLAEGDDDGEQPWKNERSARSTENTPSEGNSSKDDDDRGRSWTEVVAEPPGN